MPFCIILSVMKFPICNSLILSCNYEVCGKKAAHWNPCECQLIVRNLHGNPFGPSQKSIIDQMNERPLRWSSTSQRLRWKLICLFVGSILLEGLANNSNGKSECDFHRLCFFIPLDWIVWSIGFVIVVAEYKWLRKVTLDMIEPPQLWRVQLCLWSWINVEFVIGHIVWHELALFRFTPQTWASVCRL